MTAPRPNFLDSIFAPQSPELQGLLSPEQQQAARRRSLFDAGISMLGTSQNHGFGEALAAGVQGGRASYSGAVQDQVAGQEYQKQQALAQARAQIAQHFASPNTPEAPADTDQRLRGMMAAFLNIGDTESAGKISEYLKTRNTADIGPKPILDKLDTGGAVVDRRFNPQTGKYEVIGTTPKTPTPMQQNTLDRFGEMTPAAQQRVITSTQTAFDRETKDYTKAAEAWSQVAHVADRAASGTHSPDDIVQLLDGISRLNNPGAVVRVGTVKLQLEKIGSYADKLKMFAARGFKGTWPNEIIQGITNAAREIAKEHERQYNDVRKRAITRGTKAGIPYMDQLLPNVWETSGSPTGGSAAPALPAGLETYKFGGR